MLAFNLGVFFRNLQGEEVLFAAKNDQCEVQFRGGVEKLQEQTDLTHHLAVTLSQPPLLCRIAFEEVEEEESLEETDVEVRMTQEVEGQETVLLQTTFRFEDITLKPAAGGEEDGPGEGPLTA